MKEGHVGGMLSLVDEELLGAMVVDQAGLGLYPNHRVVAVMMCAERPPAFGAPYHVQRCEIR